MSDGRYYPKILIRTAEGITEKDIPTNPVNSYLNALLMHTAIDNITIDARNELSPGSPGDFIVFSGAPCTWLRHRIFTHREAIFAKKSTIANCPSYAKEFCFVYGKLLLSKDGTKITATAPPIDKTGCAQRISTDLEILKYISKKHGCYAKTIYWYYDPEP